MICILTWNVPTTCHMRSKAGNWLQLVICIKYMCSCFMFRGLQTQKERKNKKSKPFFHNAFFPQLLLNFVFKLVEGGPLPVISGVIIPIYHLTNGSLRLFHPYRSYINNPIFGWFFGAHLAGRFGVCFAPEQFWIQPLASSSMSSPGLALMIPRILGFFRRPLGIDWRRMMWTLICCFFGITCLLMTCALKVWKSSPTSNMYCRFDIYIYYIYILIFFVINIASWCMGQNKQIRIILQNLEVSHWIGVSGATAIKTKNVIQSEEVKHSSTIRKKLT